MEDLRDPDGPWIDDHELKTLYNWNNQQTAKFKQLVLKLDAVKESVKQEPVDPQQEPVDPPQELVLVVINYEAEFQFETDHKQQDTTVVSDRVFSKQKQEIIDRYIASKIARINKNESLIDILSDYAFHTLNDPILNHFEQQIMAFFATK
eukprot:373731_1